jgi:hypothetical protein
LKKVRGFEARSCLSISSSLSIEESCWGCKPWLRGKRSKGDVLSGFTWVQRLNDSLLNLKCLQQIHLKLLIDLVLRREVAKE